MIRRIRFRRGRENTARHDSDAHNAGLFLQARPYHLSVAKRLLAAAEF